MFSLKFRQKLPPAVADELDKFLSALNAFLSVSFNQDGTLQTQITTAIGETSAIPTGAILAYGGSSAPSGYLLCDGSAVNRSTYAALFAVIGAAYGSGNGTTTFNIPDMRGRFPFGKATSGTGSTLGGPFGSVDHTHTGPSHTHAITALATSQPSASVGMTAGAVSVATATHTHTTTGTSDASGAGNTGSANPPGLVHNYIIRTGL